MRLSTILKGLLTFLFVIFCTFGAILYSTDISRYKTEISTLVETLTDRKFIIKGTFKVSLGLKPAIAVDRVTFSNAKWGSRRDMVRIKSLRAELELLPLLYGEIRIKRVVLSGADILLETRADGLGNWVLLPSSKKTEGLPVLPTFDKVLIKNSVLVWRNRKTNTKSTVKIRRLRTSAASASAPLKLNLRGSYNGQALRLTGNINSLASLTSNKPTSLQLKLKSGGAWFKARGQIKEPMSGANIKVSVSGAGKNLAALSGLFGTELPSIGPYELSAIVADKKSRWRLTKVKLKVGKSDLDGDIYVDPNTRPVRVYAKLQSKLTRIVDFEEKGTKAKSAGSKKKRKRKSRRKGNKKSAQRVFSSDRLSFSGPEDVAVKLSLKADKLLVDDLLFEKAALTAALRKGRFILKPAKAKFEGGNLSLSFDLRSVKRKLRLKLKASAKRMDLGKLAKRLGYPGLATGRINMHTTLSGSGTSFRTIMAGLDGQFLTTMKRGRINNKKFTHLSGETLAAILPWSSGTKGIPVKCLVGQYGIKNGRLVSNVTILDTDRLLVKGEGGIDFRSEKIDFTIAPKAKEVSVMNLLVPIKIEGRLAALDVYADPAGVAKNALGFATGGILANGLVSEIIGSIVSGLSGEEKATPCLAAISEARKAGRSSGKNTKRTKRSKGKGEENVFDSIGDGLKSLFSR